jgi:toxin CcdB
VARFTAYSSREIAGYLLDVQTDLLDALPTRIVIPLIPVGDVPRSEPRLHPVFEIKETQVMLVTHQLSAVPKSILDAAAADLSDEADRITAAVDFLMQGF